MGLDRLSLNGHCCCGQRCGFCHAVCAIAGRHMGAGRGGLAG